MEVWNSDWIDPALTILGYLLAGGLGAVIYAARQAKRTAEATNPADARSSNIKAVPGDEAESTIAEPRPGRRTRAAGAGQFVDLSNHRSGAAAAATEMAEKPRGNHRDRPEIVRLAKEMLKAGTAPQIIRRTLPITEAELALLQYANTK